MPCPQDLSLGLQLVHIIVGVIPGPSTVGTAMPTKLIMMDSHRFQFCSWIEGKWRMV